MAIGDFLAGAGQVGAGIRRAQREVRADRLAQLQMEEANRVQQMYNQLNQEMRQGGLNYKGITPGQMMELEVVEAKKPAAPAKKAGVSKPAAPAPAPAPAPLSGGAGDTTLGGGAVGDRLEPAKNRPGASQGIEYLTPAEEAELAKLDKLFVTPAFKPTTGSNLSYATFRGYGIAPEGTISEAQRNLQEQMRPRYNELRAKQQAASAKARVVGEDFARQLGIENEARSRGIQLPTATPAAVPAAVPAAAPTPTAGVTPPEARPAAAQPTGDVSPVAPRTPQEVVASETAIAEQPVSQQTRTKASFYLADPTKITYEMQRTMDRREELVRYANIMLASRTAQGLQAFMQVKAQINTIDDNMIELQGMQGLRELTDHNDPRRLAGVLSLMSGGNLAIQPRTDGTYNVVAAPGTASATPILEGASTNELSVYAMKRFSPAYRAQEEADARTLQMEATKTDFEIQKIRAGKLMDMSRAEMEAMVDLQKAILGYRGKVDAASIKAAAERAGIKLFNGGDGVIYGEGDNGVTYRLAPATTETVEDNWIFPDVTRDLPERLIPIQLGQGG